MIFYQNIKLQGQWKNIDSINLFIGQNMKLGGEKLANLLPIFKQTFLKSMIAEPQIYTLLCQAEFLQLDTNAILYRQGDPIEHYYFLTQGMIGLYRSKPRPDITAPALVNHNDFLEMIQGTKVIGEYFNCQHSLRQCAAVAREDFTQVVKICKKIFHSICHSLVVQYNEIQKYAKDNLKVGKKINCFDIFSFKNYRLGSSIKLAAELGVIVKGQCKILSISNPKPEEQNVCSKGNLPPIFRPNNKVTKHEIALINENEWIFTQNLEENIKEDITFKYVVTSSNLCLLIIPVAHADILSPSKLAMLMKMHQERKLRVNYQQRLSCQISEQRELSNSPSARKQWKMDNAQKILKKLDPNLSPNLILKKYKLGYNTIRLEKYERKQRNSLISELEKAQKEKTDRKLKKYYQAKDWSQYIKIPNFHL